MTCPLSQDNPLKELPEEVLEEFEMGKTTTHYKRGQVVFHEGQNPYGVYCMTSGKVKLTKYTPQGKSYIARIANSGDLLGYRSFLTHETYSATAETLEDSSICFLDKTIFLKALQNHPQFALQLLTKLGEDLKAAEDKARDLAYRSVQERLAELLLTLKESFGEEMENNQIKLNVQMTREEMASMLGTTVETTVRQLTLLKQKGILILNKKHLIIKDLDALYEVIPEF